MFSESCMLGTVSVDAMERLNDLVEVIEGDFGIGGKGGDDRKLEDVLGPLGLLLLRMDDVSTDNDELDKRYCFVSRMRLLNMNVECSMAFFLIVSLNTQGE